MDSDDEVRDRATFYMNILQQKQKALNAAYIFNGKKKTHTQGLCWAQDVSVCMRDDFVSSAALRSVCLHPRPREGPAPIHFRAVWQTFRHEVCPPGDHPNHRAENRYNTTSLSLIIYCNYQEFGKISTFFFFSRNCSCCHQQAARKTGSITTGHLPR